MNTTPLMYLDFRSATEKAMRDYPYMKHIYETAKKEIVDIEDQMASIHSPSWDGMPKIHNNNANEERILNGMEKIDLFQKKYEEAVNYMKWFLPAWNLLSEEDQFVLNEFYISTPEEQRVARFTVADRFCIDENSAYRRKQRALYRLQRNLYGK